MTTILVAAGLTGALAACGSGDMESTATFTTGSGAAEANPEATDTGGATGKSGSQKQSAGINQGQTHSDIADAYHGPSASSFVPKHHNDSHSGSAQFRVDGSDRNSIQDFGSEADDSEFDEVATALHNFLDARAQGNWAAMCKYFASRIIESLELAVPADMHGAADCPGLIASQGAYTAMGLFRSEARKANIASARVDGERVFAIYSGSEGNVYAFPMEKEDSGWKVTAVAPLPICLRSLAGKRTTVESCTNGSSH